jgi:hypothetical protein
MLSLNDIQDEISDYIKYFSSSCFDSEKISANLEEMEIETIINKESVQSIINIPTKITLSNGEKEFDSFIVETKSDLQLLYETAQMITLLQVSDTNFVCLSCLSEVKNKTGVNITLKEVEDTNGYSMYYTLVKENLELNFMHYLNKQEAETRSLNILDSYAVVGKQFSYKILSDKEVSVDTHLFEISDNTITFTPEEKDIGYHLLTASTDTKAEIFSLEIIPVPRSPVFDTVELPIGYIGEVYNTTIEAHGEGGEVILYLDNTELFIINAETGNILL